MKKSSGANANISALNYRVSSGGEMFYNHFTVKENKKKINNNQL